MKFKNYLDEIIDLDKSLRDIEFKNDTWVFDLNDIKYRVFFINMTIEIDNKPYQSKELYYQVFDDHLGWTTKYRKSKVNAGILASKLISIIYNFIKKYKPKVFSMTAHDRNIIRLYDLIWARFNKHKYFNEYTPYFKTKKNIKIYHFIKNSSLLEDIFMRKYHID